MTTLYLPRLRRELAVAQRAYIDVHDAYWVTRHETETFSAWEAAAARLDRALAALLTALPAHDRERDRVAEAQARLHGEIARVQARVNLEALRVTT